MIRVLKYFRMSKFCPSTPVPPLYNKERNRDF
nr:MAG TPA: hypothetical protein [Caudoviricetes sp.]